MYFFNRCFDKNRLKALILWLLNNTDEDTTLDIVEKLKDLGFQYATKAGLSLSIDDLKIPPRKDWVVSEAGKLVEDTHQEYLRGRITSVESIQQLVDTWHRASEILKKEVIQHFQATDILNPVYMMAFSGARGNISQVRQLVGMRGLMADPQGQIIGFPIRSNFKEGLTVTEYMISCYGARKGLVDTALRTADAGYLTRRLVDVSQHVVVRIPTCATKKGIFLKDIKDSGKVLLSLKDRLIGRVLSADVLSSGSSIPEGELVLPPLPAHKGRDVNTQKVPWSPLFTQSEAHQGVAYEPPGKDEKKGWPAQRKTELGTSSSFSGVVLPQPLDKGRDMNIQPLLMQSEAVPLTSPKGTEEGERNRKGSFIGFRNQEISPSLATKLAYYHKKILVRSPLTCSAQNGICQMCYGWSLSEGRLVTLGEAVGIVAAQSIGEPGTQLTMRTFHTGGVFSGDVLDEIKAPFPSQVFFNRPLQGVLIRTPHGKIGFLTRNKGQIICKNIFYERRRLNKREASNDKNSQNSSYISSIAQQASPYPNSSAGHPDAAQGHKSLSFTLGKQGPGSGKQEGRTREGPRLKAQEETTVFQIERSTILFVRQNENVPKDYLLAESSSLQSQTNERAEAKKIVFSEISGQVFFSQMVVGRMLDKDGQFICSSRDLGSIWILAGQSSETSFCLPFYKKGSHLVNQSTLIGRAHFGSFTFCSSPRLSNSNCFPCSNSEGNPSFLEKGRKDERELQKLRFAGHSRPSLVLLQRRRKRGNLKFFESSIVDTKVAKLPTGISETLSDPEGTGCEDTATVSEFSIPFAKFPSKSTISSITKYLEKSSNSFFPKLNDISEKIGIKSSSEENLFSFKIENICHIEKFGSFYILAGTPDYDPEKSKNKFFSDTIFFPKNSFLLHGDKNKEKTPIDFSPGKKMFQSGPETIDFGSLLEEKKNFSKKELTSFFPLEKRREIFSSWKNLKEKLMIKFEDTGGSSLVQGTATPLYAERGHPGGSPSIATVSSVDPSSFPKGRKREEGELVLTPGKEEQKGRGRTTTLSRAPLVPFSKMWQNLFFIWFSKRYVFKTGGKAWWESRYFNDFKGGSFLLSESSDFIFSDRHISLNAQFFYFQISLLRSLPLRKQQRKDNFIRKGNSKNLKSSINFTYSNDSPVPPFKTKLSLSEMKTAHSLKKGRKFDFSSFYINNEKKGFSDFNTLFRPQISFIIGEKTTKRRWVSKGFPLAFQYNLQGLEKRERSLVSGWALWEKNLKNEKIKKEYFSQRKILNLLSESNSLAFHQASASLVPWTYPFSHEEGCRKEKDFSNYYVKAHSTPVSVFVNSRSKVEKKIFSTFGTKIKKKKKQWKRNPFQIVSFKKVEEFKISNFNAASKNSKIFVKTLSDPEGRAAKVSESTISPLLEKKLFDFTTKNILWKQKKKEILEKSLFWSNCFSSKTEKTEASLTVLKPNNPFHKKKFYDNSISLCSSFPGSSEGYEHTTPYVFTSRPSPSGKYKERGGKTDPGPQQGSGMDVRFENLNLVFKYPLIESKIGDTNVSQSLDTKVSNFLTGNPIAVPPKGVSSGDTKVSKFLDTKVSKFPTGIPAGIPKLIPETLSDPEGTGCENTATAKVSEFLDTKVSKFPKEIPTEIPETLTRAALSDPEGRAAKVSEFSIPARPYPIGEKKKGIKWNLRRKLKHGSGSKKYFFQNYFFSSKRTHEARVSIKPGWIYIPKNSYRAVKLHKSYKSIGTGYWEGVERSNFDPWSIQVECLPRIFPWSKIFCKDIGHSHFSKFFNLNSQNLPIGYGCELRSATNMLEKKSKQFVSLTKKSKSIKLSEIRISLCLQSFISFYSKKMSSETFKILDPLTWRNLLKNIFLKRLVKTRLSIQILSNLKSRFSFLTETILDTNVSPWASPELGVRRDMNIELPRRDLNIQGAAVPCPREEPLFTQSEAVPLTSPKGTEEGEKKEPKNKSGILFFLLADRDASRISPENLSSERDRSEKSEMYSHPYASDDATPYGREDRLPANKVSLCTSPEFGEKRETTFQCVQAFDKRKSFQKKVSFSHPFILLVRKIKIIPLLNRKDEKRRLSILGKAENKKSFSENLYKPKRTVKYSGLQQSTGTDFKEKRKGDIFSIRDTRDTKVSKFPKKITTEIPETLTRAALSDPEGRAAKVSEFSIPVQLKNRKVKNNKILASKSFSNEKFKSQDFPSKLSRLTSLILITNTKITTSKNDIFSSEQAQGRKRREFEVRPTQFSNQFSKFSVSLYSNPGAGQNNSFPLKGKKHFTSINWSTRSSFIHSIFPDANYFLTPIKSFNAISINQYRIFGRWKKFSKRKKPCNGISILDTLSRAAKVSKFSIGDTGVSRLQYFNLFEQTQKDDTSISPYPKGKETPILVNGHKNGVSLKGYSIKTISSSSFASLEPGKSEKQTKNIFKIKKQSFSLQRTKRCKVSIRDTKVSQFPTEIRKRKTLFCFYKAINLIKFIVCWDESTKKIPDPLRPNFKTSFQVGSYFGRVNLYLDFIRDTDVSQFPFAVPPKGISSGDTLVSKFLDTKVSKFPTGIPAGIPAGIPKEIPLEELCFKTGTSSSSLGPYISPSSVPFGEVQGTGYEYIGNSMATPSSLVQGTGCEYTGGGRPLSKGRAPLYAERGRPLYRGRGGSMFISPRTPFSLEKRNRTDYIFSKDQGEIVCKNSQTGLLFSKETKTQETFPETLSRDPSPMQGTGTGCENTAEVSKHSDVQISGANSQNLEKSSILSNSDYFTCYNPESNSSSFSPVAGAEGRADLPSGYGEFSIPDTKVSQFLTEIPYPDPDAGQGKSTDKSFCGSSLENAGQNYVLTKEDQYNLSIEQQKPTVSIGQLLHYGEEIAFNIATAQPGQILAIDKNKICIRKGQAVLFYSGGLNHVSHGQFVAKNSPLLTLTYQKLITGDIVQGIPKIEQFFEAPATKDGEPLSESLGLKLRQAFHRFRGSLSLPLAARQSVAEIQEFVVEGIQKVYLSQGVLISDKHIEIIVRQMTSKGKIVDGGNTGLLPGEYINLQRIESINLSTQGRRADYEPAILGITQASLDSESFISAASFQETTRVLSRDSLEGKTDFLRGLKERVVLGDLIQAGTGLDENLTYGLVMKEEKEKNSLMKYNLSNVSGSKSENKQNFDETMHFKKAEMDHFSLSKNWPYPNPGAGQNKSFPAPSSSFPGGSSFAQGVPPQAVPCKGEEGVASLDAQEYENTTPPYAERGRPFDFPKGDGRGGRMEGLEETQIASDFDDSQKLENFKFSESIDNLFQSGFESGFDIYGISESEWSSFLKKKKNEEN
jgi:DNA-directed RNA polymerase subunit beta'